MIEILNGDEYILQRAILSTPCFNHKDETDTQCTKCLLAGWCQVASVTDTPPAIIRTEGGGEKYPRAIFALICSGCEEEISTNQPYVELPGRGVFHPYCAERGLP